MECSRSEEPLQPYHKALKFRYTQRTGSWLSIITLVAYILTKVSVTALTGGIFFEYLWGLNFWAGAIGLIILTTIFTVFGGMKGVMTLSTIQTPILVERCYGRSVDGCRISQLLEERCLIV